jgi:hypothetical protein
VVEDHLSIQLLELAAAQEKAFRTRWRPATSRSISSGIVYR